MNNIVEEKTSNNPNYGASDHYLQQAGEAYFSEKRPMGDRIASWNLPLWLKYIRPEDVVLDFGCGGGYLLNLLPSREKLGIDINPAAREQAQALGVNVYPSLDALSAQKFTRILSSHALEHVPHPLVLLRDFQRYLQPDGLLLLLLPLDDWRNKSNRTYRKTDTDHHLYTWTPQILGNLLNEAGYEIRKLDIIVDALPVKITILDAVRRYPLLRHPVGWMMSVMLQRRQLFAVASLTAKSD